MFSVTCMWKRSCTYTFWHSSSARWNPSYVWLFEFVWVFLRSWGHFWLINSLNREGQASFFVVNLEEFFKFANQITLKSPSNFRFYPLSIFNTKYAPWNFHTVKMNGPPSCIDFWAINWTVRVSDVYFSWRGFLSALVLWFQDPRVIFTKVNSLRYRISIKSIRKRIINEIEAHEYEGLRWKKQQTSKQIIDVI